MSTIAWLTARSLLGRRRVWLLIPLPALVVLLATLAEGAGVSSESWARPVIGGLGLGVLLPVIPLLVGTSVLGSEIDDGTIVYVLTKPLPRWQIVLPKLAVAIAVSATAVAVPLFVAGVVAHSVRLGGALVVAGVIGATAYAALFVALSVVTRRPVLLGLVYVLVWEGLLAKFMVGTRMLSLQQYAVALADRIAPTPLLSGDVGVPLALAMCAVIVVGSTAVAIRRLTTFSMAGETS
ncbi:MAG TPA: ABC transporter permease subunit [Micromonospora sp.]